MSSAWRLPAEWEPQAGTLLVWPHERTDWAPDLARAENAFVTVARAIARRQVLVSVCSSDRHRVHVEQRLRAAGAPPRNLRFAIATCDDTWARDFGPLTLVDDCGATRLLDFRFNGWGSKYPAAADDGITRTLHRTGVFGDTELTRSELVVEGGALESDGVGTLLAVRRTLIDARRNPNLSAVELTRQLLALTGAERLCWLDVAGLSGDDTDGHVDTLVRFVDPATLVHVTALQPDPDHARTAALAAALTALRRRDGRPYRLVPLPSPGDIRDHSGRRLPASYANFQLINDAILIPVYDSPQDDTAIGILAALHPGREAIPIDARTLIAQNGSLHCLCMHLPQPLSIAPRPE